MDPMQSTGFKFVQMMLTILVSVPTLLRSSPSRPRWRLLAVCAADAASSAGFRLCLGSAQLTAFANGIGTTIWDRGEAAQGRDRKDRGILRRRALVSTARLITCASMSRRFWLSVPLAGDRFQSHPTQNAQTRHFCTAALSSAFASTQFLEPLPLNCCFFQNGASVFK